MFVIEGFGVGEDCFVALCFSCFVSNFFLNRIVFLYDKSSLVKIGVSAFLEVRFAIELLLFIFCFEM